MLLDAIGRWTEWVRLQKSLGGIEVGDAIARNGREAIEVLRGLNVNSPAFRGDDDPEHPGPASWWPCPPSENLAWLSDPLPWKEINEELFIMNHVLLPHLQNFSGVLAASPDAALVQAEAKCRLLIDNGPKASATLDHVSYEVPPEVADLLKALVEAAGQPVRMTDFRVRSRQIDALPEALRDLIERSPGKGCRIPRENLRT